MLAASLSSARRMPCQGMVPPGTSVLFFAGLSPVRSVSPAARSSRPARPIPSASRRRALGPLDETAGLRLGPLGGVAPGVRPGPAPACPLTDGRVAVTAGVVLTGTVALAAGMVDTVGEGAGAGVALAVSEGMAEGVGEGWGG